MTLKNIKQQGFTIVELLIVIVVIGILAAITIVAYTSITTRAALSSNQSAASAVQSAAEAYNGANGSYPVTVTTLQSGGTNSIAKLPTGLTILSLANITAVPAATDTGAEIVAVASWTSGTSTTAFGADITANNGDNKVAYFHTGTVAAPTGGAAFYFDPTTGKVNAFYVGAATATTTLVDPGN